MNKQAPDRDPRTYAIIALLVNFGASSLEFQRLTMARIAVNS